MLYRSSHQKNPTDWAGAAQAANSGSFILFQDNDPKTKWDVWALPLDGDRKPFPLVQSAFNETNGRISPDGRRVAWTSDESGRNEIYVQSFQPGGAPAGGRWQVSTKGGDNPRWRRDGNELFYVAPDGKLMSVEVRGAKSFETGVPRELFDLRGIRAMGGNYTVSTDGRKFLIATNLEEMVASPFTIVLNWAAELRP